MRTRRSSAIRPTTVPALGAAVLTGCASVDTTPDYDRAVHEIRSATGAANVYHPNNQDGLTEREAALLEEGLELREAVELLGIAQDNRDAAARLVEIAGLRLEAAAATAIDRSLAELELLDTEVVLLDAKFDAGEKRRAFTTLLGYDHIPREIALTGALPGSADTLPDVEVLAVAERRRQHGLVAKLGDGGIEAERDDDWALGPAIRLELPIFDQNQAQIAKAVEALSQHEALLRAVTVSAAQDVSSVFARTQTEWDAVRLYTDQVARAGESLDLTRQSYEAGKTTITPVIEAQRKLLSARRMHALRLRAAATAISDLERATGTPREELLKADERQGRKQP